MFCSINVQKKVDSSTYKEESHTSKIIKFFWMIKKIIVSHHQSKFSLSSRNEKENVFY